MKKSLVVVALAGAMAFTAASAETVLYGSIRLGMEVAKNHNNASGLQNKRGLDMHDYGSRIGLKGSEDLGNGAKVIFNLEWGFNGMEGGQNGGGFYNRKAYLGVTGDWGTVTIGRQDNPFTESLNSGTEADEFNGNLGSVSALRYATGTVVQSAAIGNAAQGEFHAMQTRVGNSIAYTSPTWSGFNFVVAGVADKPEAGDYYAVNNASKGLDIWTIGLNYVNENGFYAKAAYLGANLTKDNKTAGVYGLNVGYSNEQFGVNADFAAGNKGRKTTDIYTATVNGVDTYSSYTNNKVTSRGWDVGAHYSFGPDYFSKIRATVGGVQVKYKGNETIKDKMTVWAVGFEQKLSTRSKVWVEYGREQRKFDGRKDHRDAVSIGLRHDF